MLSLRLRAPGSPAGRNRTLALLTALALGLTAAPAPAAQVSKLVALHRDGQTFLTWRTPQIGDTWTYRVYACPHPIAAVSDLVDTTLVAVVGDSSWYDRRLSVRSGKTYGYVVDPPRPALDASDAMCVLTADASRTRWYFVTSQLGTEPEDFGVSPGENSLVAPVIEQPGIPVPVFQRTLVLGEVQTLADVYTLWTSDRSTPGFPAMANRPGLAFDCVVSKFPGAGLHPLMVNMHQRGGSFLDVITGSGYPGEWVLALDDPLPNGENSFWFGYHPAYDIGSGSNPAPVSGVVQDYTFRRVLHTLMWARRTFPIDTTRVYASGASMGGIGSHLLAFHRPDLVAGILSWVGKFDFSFLDDPNPLNLFNAGAVLRVVIDRMWGTVATNLPSSDGYAVYETLNDGFLAGAREAGGICPIVAINGRNDWTVGWAEKIGLYQSMQQHRQGGYFFWDTRSHVAGAPVWSPMQDSQYLYRYRTNLSYPALHDCAADSDPGDGTLASGDSVGCINAFVEWGTVVVDEPAVWEVELALRDLQTTLGPLVAPDSTLVGVTPRRLQRFVTGPGAPFHYRVTRVADGAVVRTGNLAADAFGLVTVNAVPVPKAGCRLRIEPGLLPGAGAPASGRATRAPERAASAGDRRR